MFQYHNPFDVVLIAFVSWALGIVVVGADSPQREARVFGGSLGRSVSSYPPPTPSKDLSNYLDPWASPLPNNLRTTGYDSSSTAAVADNSIIQNPTKNNYKLTVSCGVDEIRVKMDFEKPFQGVVYSKGYFNQPDCVYIRGSSHETVFNFTIAYDRCGSFNRQAQAPIFPSTPPTTVATTTPFSTTSDATSNQADSSFSRSPSDGRIVDSAADLNMDDFDSWLARRQSATSTTTQEPLASFDQLPTNPSAATPPLPYTNVLATPNVNVPLAFSPQQYPQIQNLQPVNNQAYQRMMQPVQQSYIPSAVPYGSGMQIPQNLLPTGLTGYNPLTQQIPMQGYPQYPNSFGQPAQSYAAYPYDNMGYVGRMGRSMTSDLPAVDIQWVENTLIIQQDSEVQDALDDAKSLQCEWKNSDYSRKVSDGYRVELVDVVRAAFPGDSVGAYMQIHAGLGPLSPEAKGVVKIGSALTLVIALTDSENKFDLFVHSCSARGSGNATSLPLVDVNGCVVRDKYMGPFIPFFDNSSMFGSNRVAFSYFQAFKFPDSAEVNIACSVTICRNFCPRQCFGKYNGDAENLIREWNKTEASRSFSSDKIFRPVSVNSSREQRKIIDTLERRLSAVNGPQRFEIKLQASAPVASVPPMRFLQLREMDDVDTNITSTVAPTASNSTGHVVKRNVQDIADVGLQKKLTVIYPKEIEGLDDSFLVPRIMEFPSSTTASLETSTKDQPLTMTSTAKSAIKSSPGTTTATMAVFVPLEKMTVAPAIYVVQDEQKHICVPMIAMIIGGAVATMLILGSLFCSFFMCCKVRQQRSKAEHSFPSVYSEPRSVAVRAFPKSSLTNL